MNRLVHPLLFPALAALAILLHPHPASAQSGESDEGFFKRLFKSGQTEAPAPLGSPQQTAIECPEVQVPPGESSVRVGGEGSTSVRYQVAVGQVARECALAGNLLTIKVGVKGRLLLGPAGSPGSFSAPLRIGIRQTLGEKMLVSKSYTVGGTISPGTTGTDFIVVTEPLAVPFTTERASDDYEVVVGFGKDAKAAPAQQRKRRQAPPPSAGQE